MPDETDTEMNGLNVRKILAANMRRLRAETGMTQKQLAQLTGLQPNFINTIENMKKWVSPETLGRLAEALQVEPGELFLKHNPWSVNVNREYPEIADYIKRVNGTLDEFRTLLDLNDSPDGKAEKKQE
jgi:transcriptional regulator with XRE-family HTH domain